MTENSGFDFRLDQEILSRLILSTEVVESIQPHIHLIPLIPSPSIKGQRHESHHSLYRPLRLTTRGAVPSLPIHFHGAMLKDRDKFYVKLQVLRQLKLIKCSQNNFNVMRALH